MSIFLTISLQISNRQSPDFTYLLPNMEDQKPIISRCDIVLAFLNLEPNGRVVIVVSLEASSNA